MKKRAAKDRSVFGGAFCYFCYAGRRLLRRGKLLCRNGFRSDGTGLAAPAAHFKLCGKAFAISVGCASKTARCPRSAVLKSVCGVSQPILSKKCPRCPRSVTPQKQHALLGRSCRKANAARRVGCVQKVTPAQPHGGVFANSVVFRAEIFPLPASYVHTLRHVPACK